MILEIKKLQFVKPCDINQTSNFTIHCDLFFELNQSLSEGLGNTSWDITFKMSNLVLRFPIKKLHVLCTNNTKLVHKESFLRFHKNRAIYLSRVSIKFMSWELSFLNFRFFTDRKISFVCNCVN